jgi:glutathione synthase/RimK-type ligase-like ATP-grasp enzyme
MADVLLATCAELPDGEPGAHLLLDALGERGVSARFAAWDDPAVDWASARLVLVRSTWDYDSRRDDFLAWCRSVGERLVNDVHAIAWNTDKAYLVDLRETSLPVVPTVAVDEEGELAPAVAAFAPAVVKPRVGAGGRGVVVFDGEDGGPEGLDESHLELGPWVVQPLVDSVRTEGETSVFVFGGDVVSQVQKRPGGDEIRVHEEYGGSSVPVPVTSEAAQLAVETVEVAEGLLGVRLPYARVDLMRLDDGRLALSELEIAEPGLYLDVVPANAGAFADLVVDLLDVPA